MTILKKVDSNIAEDLTQLGWAIPYRSLYDYKRTGMANGDIPYLDQVIKWFREQHKIHIEVYREIEYKYEEYLYRVDAKLFDAGKYNNLFNKYLFILVEYDYEQAQIKGIEKAISMLKYV